MQNGTKEHKINKRENGHKQNTKWIKYSKLAKFMNKQIILAILKIYAVYTH